MSFFLRGEIPRQTDQAIACRALRRFDRVAVAAACWALVLSNSSLAPRSGVFAATDQADVNHRSLASMPVAGLPPSLVSPMVASRLPQANQCANCQMMAPSGASGPVYGARQTLGSLASGNVVNVASVVNRSLYTPSQSAAMARASVPVGMSPRPFLTTAGAQSSPVNFTSPGGARVSQPASVAPGGSSLPRVAPVFETPWWNPTEGLKPENLPWAQ